MEYVVKFKVKKNQRIFFVLAILRFTLGIIVVTCAAYCTVRSRDSVLRSGTPRKQIFTRVYSIYICRPIKNVF